MKIKLAEKLYHGKEGYNCAQAILKAFQPEYSISEHIITKASENGTGKAENGICGALYAAHYLLKEPTNINKINQDFIVKGGSIRCKEIRRNRKLSCKECVKLAAENLQRFRCK
ncbi:C-GCAxxG-C-C family (seleno)protein [Plebeiibacterium marinum]|uniref:C-GCAxxG-C-C family protein n=1 Tax=Plebeiibacterium marinum TaxID=2992111 RepID=A0AAE3MI64_9BACT|nr:C-GCAxxG-C-C family (seleno)protein [Plebeiobacterium marinum]MCW3807542.1 C-GCAxxG-C-C family protein [Plebeiobacterium marinum]